MIRKQRSNEWSPLERRSFAAPLVLYCVLPVIAAIVMGLSSRPAYALPSFARQTGQPCGTCHTDFPALTPYGRRFKLLGYTTGGGPYRTTPFSRPSVDVGREYD